MAGIVCKVTPPRPLKVHRPSRMGLPCGASSFCSVLPALECCIDWHYTRRRPFTSSRVHLLIFTCLKVPGAASQLRLGACGLLRHSVACAAGFQLDGCLH